MKEYNFSQIETKWQKKWQEDKIYKTKEELDKPKCFVLDMFPYPSGEGLHVGHPKGYIATDIYSRYKRLNGFNTLHPMGWDAFGLPAENYALKNKIHPKVAVTKNVIRFKEQLEKIGFDYDWDREINTTDEKYYKWTQWIFLQLFKNDLAYESDEPINWCPSCKTGLASEDLEDGRCERCSSPVEKKPLRQWVLRMKKYADRLIDDLELVDWEKQIVDQQINWIGRSEGVQFKLSVKDSEENIDVYTTRIDTVFGMTYVVLSPENNLVDKITIDSCRDKVKSYQEEAKQKSEIERLNVKAAKTGVFTGAYAVNPFNNKEIPIYIADYVLSSYGTGAVMAVPAHDQRDFEFAKKHNIEIIEVIKSKKENEDVNNELDSAFEEYGVLMNSENYSDLTSQEAIDKMAQWVVEKNIGERKVMYRLKDWVFSRQRYWGEPIPIVHCPTCGVVPVPEEELPVRLPAVDRYELTDTGESPLASISDWVNTTCPKCKEPAKRETNTMPQWAGSCWYYLRYIDPDNNESLVDEDKEKYWMNVDMYVGGAEHATRHLLYARFWHKFLYDIGVVSTKEPFQKLYHVGLIAAEDGRKMSKRWGNVINPDSIVAEYGADSLRLYEMFIGPFNQGAMWSTNGLEGINRFVKKIWRLLYDKEIVENESDTSEINFNEQKVLINNTIKKVSNDIENFAFNTAISAMMIFVNELLKQDKILKSVLEDFVKIISPFAPHLAEEAWHDFDNKESIMKTSWPVFDKTLVDNSPITYIVQINGKLRDKIEVSNDKSDDEVKEIALNSEKVKKYTNDKEIKNVIIVPKKLINIVIK